MEPNKEEALKFIEALAGSPDADCTFQTFSDDGKSPELAEIFHGSLEDNWDDLSDYNKSGAGVFVTVNETDLLGRRKDNVVKARALFVDSDTGELRINGGAKPNIVVHSKSGDHAYWVLREGNLHNFREGQRFLADALQTDPSVKDESRVMRMPGFIHRKGQPYYVSCSVMHDKKYTMKEVTEAFKTKSTKYGLGALRKACDAVRNQSHPGRHDTLVKELAGLWGLIKGKELEESEAQPHMRNAFADCMLQEPCRPWVGEFNDAWKWAEQIAEPRFKEQRVEQDDSGPMDIWQAADLMMKDITAMRDVMGNVYLYDGRKWEPSSKLVLESMSRKYERHRDHTKKSRREQIVDDVLSTPGVQQYEQIEWNKMPETWAPLKSGMLDIISGKVYEHSPDNRLDKYLPVEYDPDAKRDLFEHCLNIWFGGDPDGESKIKALQEFFGYIILNHARFKKFLMLYGQPNTGKSAIAGVMTDLLSMENICQIKVSKLGDSRALAPIQGKMINLITDLSEHDTIDDGGIKRLASTEEWVEIDAKYSKPIVYKPTCKHVFITNSLPGINDKTTATFDRMLLIETINEIQPKLRDDRIAEKLRKEMPGILNWCVDGARRITESKGRFTSIKSSESLVDDYREQNNPFIRFLEEKCEKTGNLEDRVPYRDMLNSYNEWRCPPGKTTGNKPCGERSFTDHLRAQKLTRKSSNSTLWVQGIRMRDELSLGGVPF